MEDFSVTMHMSAKEYSKVMYVGLYKKPTYIIATLLGVYFIATVVLNQLNIISYYSGFPYLELFAGLFALLFPTMIIRMALKHLRSNPSFNHDLTYTIGENGIIIQGLTFKGEFTWEHILKRQEIGKFLILNHNKKMGNFIDKTKLTDEQLQFIRSKVPAKKKHL